MNKQDLELNILQRLLCYKTKPNQVKLIIKQFYLTKSWDPYRYYHSESEWNRE